MLLPAYLAPAPRQLYMASILSLESAYINLQKAVLQVYMTRCRILSNIFQCSGSNTRAWLLHARVDAEASSLLCLQAS